VILQIKVCGAQSLGIVTLVGFLVGLILAFVGAVELRVFGAEIYVANLVGVAMVRELGALMAAFVVAGRTGAAFAAELGTMRVSQELDALATLGIPPMELLVVPRVVALTLMLPLLTIYADFVGLLGGALVGVGTLGLSPALYLQQTAKAVTTVHLWGGLGKAAAYGLLIALGGCLHGLRSGSSAAAVGQAATRAVVTGIVLVIAACGAFAVIFFEMGW
jgi:phospholipid/cholesterol/gamma-HCH transport system permease protein